jgi:hypothetical protein
MARTCRIALEIGKKWVFAYALDWPGWCRRDQGEEAAVDTLYRYSARYRAVAGGAFKPGAPEIVGRLTGNATTDFGAPSTIGRWDEEALAAREASRQLGLLQASWRALDDVVAGAPPSLRKGPRGGGRDRDKIADHVREAERAYASKLAVRLPVGTPWREGRERVVAALRAPDPEAKWPARYALRRIAWHALDHAWEIEDRST